MSETPKERPSSAVIQDLAVVMAQHGPEAAQGPGGDRDSQLGDVPFQEGRHVLIPPEQAFLVRLPPRRIGAIPHATTGS